MTAKYHLTIFLLLVFTCTFHKSVSAVVTNIEVQDDFSISKYLVNNAGVKARDAPCGGVLEAFDEFSTLSYLMEKPYDRQYLSCIWTIQATNRTLIKINVIDPLYYDTFEFLAVGYFNKSNYDSIDSLTWIKLPASFKPQYLEVPGPVAFIHYSTTRPYILFGFRLTYGAAGDMHRSIFNFDNYFLEGEYGIFRYPPSGQYRNNQRTTIVVKAYSENSNPAKGYASHLHILNKGIEDSPNCTADTVSLYGYGESSASWYRNISMCGSKALNWAIFSRPRNDPLILTFKSDDSEDGGGFEIRWMEHAFIP